jgi:uncharacterized damage-inducible protein DinB
MTDLRYPAGTLTYDPDVTPDKRRAWIQEIAATPRRFRAALEGLTDAQLDMPYRPGGWTVRQLAHHVTDSHVNAYCRLKLAMTEDNPTIKPYDQDAWAGLADTARTPVAVSLSLLDAVHHRWVVLLESLSDQDFARPLVHPEYGPLTIDRLLQMYAWHGRHHVAHLVEWRKREGF